MTDHSQKTLEGMEAMLRRCRRRIMRAEVSVRLRKGLEFYLTCLFGIAGIFLLLRVVAYVLGTPAVLTWGHAPGIAAVIAAVIFGAAIFGRALLRGLLGKPVHATKAAERLDLSQSTHNRIATAIALLRSGDDSRFAKAAIHDGFEYLERLQAEDPYVEPSTTSWRRKGVFLALSLSMVLAGLFLEAEPRPPRSDSPSTPGATLVAKLDPRPGPLAPDIKAEPKEHPAARGGRQPSADTPPREDDPSNGDRGKRPEPGAESRSEGPAGQHASGNSRSSQSSSNSRSAASGAGVKSEPGTTEPGKGRKQRDTKKQTAGQPKVDQNSKKGGSINARGSSGTGSMRTAQNEWSSKVKAKSGDNDDLGQEEEPDEEVDPDKQRLGMQPALKNRASRISRELSLSTGTGLNNSMTRGRGGPGALKKSRGTATMIMGVPVPGFVKGRLLPGPTKSTQEEVEPSPREGDYATASELQHARPEEDPQERYRPSPAMSAQARDYLIKYHAENENRQNGAATNK